MKRIRFRISRHSSFGQVCRCARHKLLLREVTAEMTAGRRACPGDRRSRRFRGGLAGGAAQRLATRTEALRMGELCRTPSWTCCRS